MAKIIKKKIKITPSEVPDLVAHRVYVAFAIEEVTYDSPMVEVPMPKLELVIPDEFPGFPLNDTNYKIGVSGVDDMGNEGDMTIIEAPFDFDAPPVPDGVEIVDV